MNSVLHIVYDVARNSNTVDAFRDFIETGCQLLMNDNGEEDNEGEKSEEENNEEENDEEEDNEEENNEKG